MTGHIHFVTPTNRWIGSIPLSTTDPLTLTPLSSYLRHDKTNNPTNNHDAVENDAEDDDEDGHKDRTTNIMGQPVSLILARLQTTSQGCSCGCTIPTPPKHSDFYHAQHLLRVIFQTQRVRSRALKNNLPQYFQRSTESSDVDGDLDSDLSDSSSDIDNGGAENYARPTRSSEFEPRSVTIPIESSPPQQQQQEQQQPDVTQKKSKIPKYVHSLIQNRTFRNPLTNMEVEGDPTFFVVLEPGYGGWWYEPWAMVNRPDGVQGLSYHHNHHQHHQCTQNRTSVDSTADTILAEGSNPDSSAQPEEPKEKTPEMIQQEKEIRKEKWRQGRIVNLEMEAQNELEWRRWQRSLQKSNSTSSGNNSKKTRVLRFKLGRDISLLEPSERGLRLPKGAKPGRLLAGKKKSTGDLEGKQTTTETNHLESSSIEDQQRQLDKPKDQSSSNDLDTLGLLKRKIDKTQSRYRSGPKVAMPWWDPDPQPFKMPNTKLSPYAISTLPEPVARHFGGRSMYSRPTTTPAAQETEAETKEHDGSCHSNSSSSESGGDNSSGCEIVEDGQEKLKSTHNSDTNGCKWVQVKPGDRVAVMIGTSKDYLLFPSFQRLFFRHLSCEDFEDRAGRVGIIPCPVSTVVMDGRRAQTGGHRRNDDETISPEGSSSQPQQNPEAVAEQGGQEASMDSEEPRSGERRSWLRWISRPNRNMTSTEARVSSTGATDQGEGRRADGDSEINNLRNRTESTHSLLPDNRSVISEVVDSEKVDHEDDKRAEDSKKSNIDHRTGYMKSQTYSFADRKKSKDERRRQKEFYLETFERENYDSSDYSFASSGEEEEAGLLYHSDIFDFSDSETTSESDSYDENDDEQVGSDSGQSLLSRMRRLTAIEWVEFIFCCRKPYRNGRPLIGGGGQTRRESRQARRRRLRQERWRLYQRNQQRLQQEQDSLAMLRYLPRSVRESVGVDDMHRCCQLAEFCRFYLTILMAIMLMGAIVYGAIQAESTPSSSNRVQKGVGGGAMTTATFTTTAIQSVNTMADIKSTSEGLNKNNLNKVFRIDQGFLSRGVNKILGKEEGRSSENGNYIVDNSSDSFINSKNVTKIERRGQRRHHHHHVQKVA